MDQTATVATLIKHYQQRLALDWITGQDGENNTVATNNTTISLVGHLNVIHHNRIQIVGQVEMQYLEGLDATARKELISRLFDARPAVVIISDNLTVPPELQDAAEASSTPLLKSSLPCTKLLNSLRYYLGTELAEQTTLHGVFMEVSGLGILLTGESSVGKSELALELISRNHRLIADDAPVFSHTGPDTIRGTCPELIRDFLEVRGLGILNIRAMYGDSAIKFSKDLSLIIHLESMEDSEKHTIDRLKGNFRSRKILDIDIPEVTLPVATGRNLAVLVEAAVRDHILLRKGYDAADAFIKRQSESIQEKDPTL